MTPAHDACDIESLVGRDGHSLAALVTADVAPLDGTEMFWRDVAAVETNVSVGFRRLGPAVRRISRVDEAVPQAGTASQSALARARRPGRPTRDSLDRAPEATHRLGLSRDSQPGARLDAFRSRGKMPSPMTCLPNSRNKIGIEAVTEGASGAVGQSAERPRLRYASATGTRAIPAGRRRRARGAQARESPRGAVVWGGCRAGLRCRAEVHAPPIESTPGPE